MCVKAPTSDKNPVVLQNMTDMFVIVRNFSDIRVFKYRFQQGETDPTIKCLGRIKTVMIKRQINSLAQ